VFNLKRTTNYVHCEIETSNTKIDLGLLNIVELNDLKNNLNSTIEDINTHLEYFRLHNTIN
jgi:hypothetical protein